LIIEWSRSRPSHPCRVVAALGMEEAAMAGESADRRSRARRARQANVAGGRSEATLVRMSPQEKTALTERAAAAGVSVPRLMVEAALSSSPETGRAHAAMALLELDTELRRIG